MSGPVRMVGSVSCPWILVRNDSLFGVSDVPPPRLARSRAAEEATGHLNVPDVGYLVKGHQAIEGILTEVRR